MQHRRIITTLAATALALGLMTTAHGQETKTTTSTFEVTATSGTLGITVPAGTSTTPRLLGSVTAGSATFAPSLGAVTVTDTRALLLATWTAKATSTDFVLTTATSTTDPNQRVLASSIVYSAVPTVTLGTGVPVVTAGTLDPATGATVVYTDSGNSTVTWDPTLTMTLQTTQVAGVYQGTITHSVS